MDTPYTLNLNRCFSEYWFVHGYENLKDYKSRFKTDSKMKAIPLSLLDMIRKSEIYNANNLIKGNAKFYHTVINGNDYYVKKYDKLSDNAIVSGKLQIKNTCHKLFGKSLYNVFITFTSEQYKLRNVVNIVVDKRIGSFIFINNNETKIPFSDVTEINFVDKGINKWMKLEL
jgi:hypothetical protein